MHHCHQLSCSDSGFGQGSVKKRFYSDIDNTIASIPRNNKVILLGDFNARVGHDHKIWRGTISKNGMGKANANGILLLTKCTQHGLIVRNTIIR
ncbi:hypothetical protein Y1Q_0007952 [Alligator mississippiensis]|uniref:Endonuclease/exonuclease/phosphatase domain-containing protein n=1 Tax=Alligator mississippiensis TaxID=8496 RepID=A0A151NF09_ALLMI|nr:hypothetical protein Y1Q_0007952 [Alligator mississippiensis]